VAQQVHDERTANGGALTTPQKQQINGEQNATSQQIYNEKHNSSTHTPNGSAGTSSGSSGVPGGSNYHPNEREANQDQRIANGLRSGQMTSGEAARAESTQSKIDQQVHDDRVANGGKLNGQEKQQIQQRAECSQPSDLQREAQWGHGYSERGEQP